MQPAKKFDLIARLKSFPHAIQGIWVLLATQHNARIHAAAGVVVFFLGWKFHVGNIKFCLLIFAMALVWIAEAFNTVFEILVDMLSPQIAKKPSGPRMLPLPAC